MKRIFDSETGVANKCRTVVFKNLLLSLRSCLSPTLFFFDEIMKIFVKANCETSDILKLVFDFKFEGNSMKLQKECKKLRSYSFSKW